MAVLTLALRQDLGGGGSLGLAWNGVAARGEGPRWAAGVVSR
ncbi:hypothetical protein [Thermocladium modestius]|nr:hypothetical protein [Thermocladium modestius]